MNIHLVPLVMRAHNFETGVWETLSLDTDAYYTWRRPATECYYIETGDEPIWADLGEYDSFKGAV